MREIKDTDKKILAAGEHKLERDFWLEKLSGPPGKSVFPRDYTLRPGEVEWGVESFRLDQPISARVQEMSKGNDNSIYMILLSAILVVLNKYTGSDDLLVGGPIYKQKSQLEFINTILVFRNRINSENSFKELILQVRQTIQEAVKHQNYPLELLLQELDVTSDGAGFPLFDVVALLDSLHEREYIESAGYNVEFLFRVAPEGIECDIRFNSRLYKAGTILRVAKHLQRVLADVLFQLDRRLGDCQLLSIEEKRLLLEEFNDTAAAYPQEETIHSLFSVQAVARPGSIALALEESQISYDFLAGRAGALASLLKCNGVTNDSIVAMLVEPSLEMMEMVLGILMAGGCYLPMDVNYPADRIRYMLKDSAAAIVCTREEYLDMLDGSRTSILPEQWHTLSVRDRAPLPSVDPGDLAYLIFTSGTTGKPKGALIEHKNVVRLLFNERDLFDFHHRDTWTLFHSYCFDFSVWEMYGALLFGGKLVIVPRMTARDTGGFLQLLAREAVTVLNQTPSAFYNLINEEAKRHSADLSLRYVIFGGEALRPIQLKTWRDKYPGVRLVNMYGITETTVHVTFKEIGEAEIEHDISNIGVPIPTLTSYVLDRDLHLVPIGVAGELCVGGLGVCRGYLNRVDLTLEKFIANPYKNEERLYRSGDLARILYTGEMEYLGRIDHQVKIRGFRIELGEIETQLLRHPDVKEVIVLDKQHAEGEKYLAAFLVPMDGKTIEISQLRDHLGRQLPDYMIPSYFMMMAKMPLTSNGKVDRKALPEVMAATSGSGEEPADEVERSLSMIWADVLGAESVGATDNYFYLGGDSIKAIRVLSRVNETFDTDLKVVDLFTNDTVRKLAQRIRNDEGGKENGLLAGVYQSFFRLKDDVLSQTGLADVLEDVYPMSDIEKGMVFHSLKDAPAAVYHDQMVRQLSYDQFDPERLKTAMSLLTGKHQILRTAFNMDDYGQPLQLVYKTIESDVQHIDLSHLDAFEQERFIREYIAGDRKRPLDISRPGIWRIRTFALDSSRIVLLWVCHHAIIDGWSDAALMTELHSTYTQLGTNPGFKPQPLKSGYKDYVAEQMAEKQNVGAKNFWRQQLENYKRLDLSLGIDPNAPRKVRGFRFDLGVDLLDRLNKAAGRSGSSLRNLCFGAYGFMMSMLSMESDLVVGMVTNNRPVLEDGDKILGCFLNTLPVRVRVPQGVSWSEFSGMIDRQLLEVKKHDKLSLMEIAQLVGESVHRQNPLFDVLFNLVDFHVYGDLAVRRDRLANDHPQPNRLDVHGQVTTNTLLDFSVDTTFGGFVLVISFTSPFFDEDLLGRMCGYFREVLTRFVSQPDRAIDRLDIMGEEERIRLLEEFNRTASDYPKESSIDALFATQVVVTPFAVAVMWGEHAFTYQCLHRESNRLAVLLARKGLQPEEPVGVLSGRNIDMVVSVLAILKSGGAYLPLNADYPPARVRYIIQDSDARMVLCDSSGDWAERLRGAAQALQINERSSVSTNGGDISPDKAHHGDSLAYIIYTSGSTGLPKGVLVEHKNVVRLVKNTNYCDFSRMERLLQTGALEFDASTFEIWGALLNGDTLCLAPKEEILAPERLKWIIRRWDIDTMWMTVALFNQLLLEDSDIFQGLEHLLVGGDALSPYHINLLRRNYPALSVTNGYGPTENTTFSTTHPINEDYEFTIPIGKPIANSTVYIVNAQGSPQPTGVPGELWTGGDGVARGYLNSPASTEQKFIPNPFTGAGRIYRSGDLARFLLDGTIQFLGRIDSQVKIRGFRIELGEIEARLLAIGGIAEAAVVARELPDNQKYLCAYIVPSGDEDLDIKAILSDSLPDYMIPSHVVRMDKLPLTANGKVDRRALPEPERPAAADYQAPESPVEKTLASLWADILGIEPTEISVLADFFDLGGHSLRATILAGRIHRQLDIRIPLPEIFNNPTIRGLAQYIALSGKHQFHALEAVEKREYYPLSPAQRRLFILQQMDTNSTVYNIPRSTHLRGKIDPAWIEATLGRLIQRHESFRTSFLSVGDRPAQRIHLQVEFRLFYEDLALGVAPVSPDALLRRFIRPFDLGEAPLLRGGLVKFEENHHLLLMDMHHIISDGASMEILQREFFSLLERRELPELRLQYKDFAVWQQSEEVSEDIRKQRSFWIDSFSGDLPALSLPVDFPRPEFQSFEGASVVFKIGAERARILRQLSQIHGVTLFMTLQAVFAITLSKLSGQEDIVIGTPVAGRRHADLEGIIGMFVNTLALRQFPTREKPLSTFLDHVKERTLQAFDNQDLPFEDLVETLSLTRDAGRNPLFDVMLVLQNTGSSIAAGVEEGDSEALDIEDGPGSVSRFDMTWTAAETLRGVEFNVEYCTRLFERDTICRFIGYFSKAIDEALNAPQSRLGDISILSDRERRLLVEEFNDTATNYPSQASVHGLFARQAESTPDWTALISEDLFVSYRELHRQSGLLATELRSEGCSLEAVVAVMMGRTASVATALLAILKCGGGYMPISSDYPPERIAYILDDSDARFLITDNIVDFQDPGHSRRKIIRLQADQPVIGAGRRLQADACVNSRSLAYILYTSGSTGMPKGVMVEHRSVVRLVKNTDYMEFLPRDRFLQTAALEFDVSTYEFWGALLNGLTLCVAPLDQILSPRHIKSLIRRLDIGTMWMTVALFNQMSQDDIDIFEGLRRIISGGDALSPYHINRLRRHYPELTIINGYGPTENTCYSTTHTIRQDYPDSIPIGRPIANSTAFVLDRDLHLCPVGVSGELCVGGDGVARGYLNRPELTAERFVNNPHKAQDRLYHTGDLSRYRADGILEFFGRLDFQVKIRGFRVELGEIENQLLSIDGIDEAVVLAKETQQRERYLCAYVGTAASLDSHTLKEELGRNLPDFMVPSYIVLLDRLPINHNGKVDRRALPEPELEAADEVEAPSSGTERRLVALWAEVLGIDEARIGVTTGFFDLGGHSLKGMQLATKVRREFGVILPLATIFRRQTVRAQAQFLAQQRPAGIDTGDDRVAALKEGSSEAGNLFFVHDGTGEVDGYIECVNSLELDLNCWGIRAEGLRSLAPDNRTVEGMAREYIARMKGIQPQGPYSLVGWSLGGAIVFEMARQLEDDGQSVSMVLLVDSPPPQMFKGSPAEEFSISSEYRFVSRHIETADLSLLPLHTESLTELWRLVAGYLRESGVEPESVARIARNHGMQGLSRLDGLDVEGILYYLNLGRTLIRARSTYEPAGSIETPVTYIAARESNDIITEDWNPYCKKLEMDVIDGDHHSVFRSPHVKRLVAVIRRILGAAAR